MTFIDIPGNDGKKNMAYQNAFFFLSKNNFRITVFSTNRSYEEMLIRFLENEMHKSEVDFLKKGIIEINDIINNIPEVKIESKFEIRKRLHKKHDGNTKELRFDRDRDLTEEEYEKYLEDSSNSEFEYESSLKDYAYLVLKYELLQFKVRIERLGVSISFYRGIVSFINQNSQTFEIKQESNIYNGENIPDSQKSVVSIIFHNNFEEENFLPDNSFHRLETILINYFETENIPNSEVNINFIKSNIKTVGWKFNLIHKSMNKKIEFPFLNFAKNCINIFKNVDLDASDYKSSKLYKYFHQKSL